MKATLNLLVESSAFVKDVNFLGPSISWMAEIDGRVHSSAGGEMARSFESLILLELAGIHAQHHARVEPTVLLVDELFDFYHEKSQIAMLEQLAKTAEHAQVAVISHLPTVVQ